MPRLRSVLAVQYRSAPDVRERRDQGRSNLVAVRAGRPEPVVPNGLCLCKIHHAAYDSDLIGISPDYTVHVRRDVRDETDGPMLPHGLQELHESRVALPNRRADRPDRDRLAWRYERYRAACTGPTTLTPLRRSPAVTRRSLSAHRVDQRIVKL